MSQNTFVNYRYHNKTKMNVVFFAYQMRMKSSKRIHHSYRP